MHAQACNENGAIFIDMSFGLNYNAVSSVM